MNVSDEERKELAQELGYSGDAHDSAKMRFFLHKEPMKKLAENGGKAPADLLDRNLGVGCAFCGCEDALEILAAI